MATYVIGDIQGCYESFRALLEHISFSFARDELWLAGDMINRGPDSLKTLRLVYEHREQIRVVLGNHDLHLLSCAVGHRKPKSRDTLQEILNAHDRNTLLDWLRAQPLLHEDRGFLMVHAGLLPSWSLKEARARARELEATLKSKSFGALLGAMQKPSSTDYDELLGGTKQRKRQVNSIAALTRARVLDKDGRPNFDYAGPPQNAPPGLRPWFEMPHPSWFEEKSGVEKIIFGHWAALGRRIMPRFYALDSGCVWGNALSAVRLEDSSVFEVSCAD